MSKASDAVEHQATVDRGLKMKIKRKNLGAAKNTDSKIVKSINAGEDASSTVKARKKKPQHVETTVTLTGEATNSVDVTVAETAGCVDKNGIVADKAATKRTGGYKNAKSGETKSEMKFDSTAAVSSEKPDCENESAVKVLPPPTGGKDKNKNRKDNNNRKRPAQPSSIEIRPSGGDSNGSLSSKPESCGAGSESLSPNSFQASGSKGKPDGLGTASSPSTDPYEFVAGLEDSSVVLHTPIKKFKSDKVSHIFIRIFIFCLFFGKNRGCYNICYLILHLHGLGQRYYKPK